MARKLTPEQAAEIVRKQKEKEALNQSGTAGTEARAAKVATYNPGAGAYAGGYGSNAYNQAVARNQAINRERAQYTNDPAAVTAGGPERVMWDAQGKIVPSVTAYDSRVERQREAQQAPGIREGTPRTGMKIYTPYGMVESTPPAPIGRPPISPSFAGAGPVPSTFGGNRRAGIVNSALQQVPIGRPPISPSFAGAGPVPSTFGGDRRAGIAGAALPRTPMTPQASFNAPAPMQPFLQQIRYSGKLGGISQTTGVKALKRFAQRRGAAARRFYENRTPWFRPETEY